MSRKATVTIVPTSGKSQEREINLPDASLGQALTAAGIATDRHDVTVDGKPATLDTPLPPGSKVQLKVQVSERPSGS